MRKSKEHLEGVGSPDFALIGGEIIYIFRWYNVYMIGGLSEI